MSTGIYATTDPDTRIKAEEPRYYVMDTDPRDGHPEIFGIQYDAGVVDNEAGGVILYGHWDECVRVADILNKEA